ncbi:hypothetical protein I7I51_08884 [Histoplasma capsulatum]|uniref:Uncharacterized protein n=1 Tax=Ajellomyces capsulatus TaxID=5037 RepID=A0A8A1M028_AJECA|nr:hypothetical protein I7I51_08884 [Histoplasma capsulatum]
MTPQTNTVNTPAVSVGGFLSRKPSICAAMSQARSICAQRTALDSRPNCTFNKTAPTETYSNLGRRSSLARSASSTSSPESMISDVPSLASSSSRSSRSSRSSSISSVASGTCAPAQPRLAMRATRRCANMQNYSLAAPAAKEYRKTSSFTSPTKLLRASASSPVPCPARSTFPLLTQSPTQPTTTPPQIHPHHPRNPPLHQPPQSPPEPPANVPAPPPTTSPYTPQCAKNSSHSLLRRLPPSTPSEATRMMATPLSPQIHRLLTRFSSLKYHNNNRYRCKCNCSRSRSRSHSHRRPPLPLRS